MPATENSTFPAPWSHSRPIVSVWNAEVCNLVHYNPQLDCIPSQINPVFSVTFCFFYIHINIILLLSVTKQ